jgi:hypothetical protein
MHIIFLAQQVGWFGGKRIGFHPWGSKINSHP